MKIDVQEFCNSFGLFTPQTIKSGVIKLARQQNVKYEDNYNPKDLFYQTGNFTALNKSAVKSVIKKFQAK